MFWWKYLLREDLGLIQVPLDLEVKCYTNWATRAGQNELPWLLVILYNVVYNSLVKKLLWNDWRSNLLYALRGFTIRLQVYFLHSNLCPRFWRNSLINKKSISIGNSHWYSEPNQDSDSLKDLLPELLMNRRYWSKGNPSPKAFQWTKDYLLMSWVSNLLNLSHTFLVKSDFCHRTELYSWQ